MEKLFFNDKEVAHALNISRSTVWHYVRTGLLNKPTKLSERVTRWTKSDIEDFAKRVKNISEYSLEKSKNIRDGQNYAKKIRNMSDEEFLEEFGDIE